MSEQFSNPEQALIERLRRAPQPELSPEARQMIHARLMDALDHPPIPAPRPRLFHPVVVIAAVLIVGALIAGGVLFVLSQQNQVVPLPTMTLEPTITAIPTNTIEPTVTPLPTNTVEPTTVAPVVVSSPMLLSTATLTLTTTLSPTVESATLIPTTTSPTVMVIQGPVEKIDGNVITIYGIQVQIAPDDPVLITVKIGDVLRVEGSQTGTTQIVIVAVVVVNVTATENGAGGTSNGGSTAAGSNQGEVWTDDGSCAHPPPDWAPANGWRRRCQGINTKGDKGKGSKQDKSDDD